MLITMLYHKSLQCVLTKEDNTWFQDWEEENIIKMHPLNGL